MSWKREVFRRFQLYAVTDITEKSKLRILEKVELAYRGGADIVQLRAKSLPAAEKIRLGLAIAQLARKWKKLYFVNDSLSLALLTGAHGLHVGQEDIPPVEIRKLCRRHRASLLLGLSTHSEKQLKQAQKEPVDYFAVGPVFQTPTKPDYQSVGLQLVRKAQKIAQKPWVAIGGIDNQNLNLVKRHGASRVAVVRAVFDAKNPEAACRRLIKKLRGEGL